jgi:hypothetical protein
MHGKDGTMMDRDGSGGSPVRGGETGAALFIMVVSVMVAAGLAFALGTVAVSRQKAVQHREGMEMALHVAEAGLSRGLAEANLPVNRADPNWPAPGFKFDAVSENYHNVYASDFSSGTPRAGLMGEFRLSFDRGDSDGLDNDGDGLVDAADKDDEEKFVTITSIGFRGLASKTNIYKVKVRGTFEKVTNTFDIQAAVFIDDPKPDVDMGSSNAYTLSGKDHDMYSKAVIGTTPPLPAIATTGKFSPTDTTDIIAKTGTQVDGTSPAYQNNNPTPFNFASVIQFAKDNAEPAHMVYGPGTNLPGPFGIPPGPTPSSPAVWEITYHDAGGPGNAVKFTANTAGAGIWVVDGDLEIGGTFNFTGIIVVTGGVSFVGGGSTKMVTGAVITGETASVENLSTTGTIDLWYSNGAVTECVNALARYVPLGYEKLPTKF